MKLTITKMKANFDALVSPEPTFNINSQDETEVKILVADEKSDVAYELCINKIQYAPGKVWLVHHGLAELVQDYLSNKKD